MVQENRSQVFRLKNIDQARNYFIEEIKQNELTVKIKNILWGFELY